MSKLSETTRQELYEAYTQMCESYNTVRETLRIQHANLIGVDQAKSYWLANLDIGLHSENYIGGNTTFRDFLQTNNIIDDDEEFIEYTDDESEEEE